MKRLILSLPVLFFAAKAEAQVTRCAADCKVEHNAELHELIHRKVQEFRSEKARKSALEEVIRIPVVVHIIHNNASGSIGGANISDEQVFSQMEVLNEDYRRMSGTPGFNTDPVGTDMQIEFFLANIDPEGHPASGINRVYSSRRSFNVLSETLTISNLSYWDSNKYLNIWVTALSGGYLGYAEFPIGNFDGLEATDIDERIDGVFIDYRAFGRKTGAVEAPYAFGRTTTHEVGHWLGLIHTWGDARCGTDYCDDTPQAEASNSTLVCSPVYSSCRGTTTRNMIENYMDYTVDSCMNIFTQDQKTRVRAILEISRRRQNLLANADIFETVGEPLVLKILGNPVEGNSLDCKVLVNEARDYKLEIFDDLGRVIFSEEYRNSLSRVVQIPKNLIGSGMRQLRLSSKGTQIDRRILSL
ncbi:MAG: zinc metalloprotease [Leadbetterella sp.]|nr:zinc metalloprotease [Leadbetterella sp.]